MGARRRRAGQHQMAQIGAKRFRESGETLGTGDEDACAAVAQDMTDLRGLEHRIDRDECAACRCRAETGNDGLEPLVEPDRNPLAPAKTQTDEPAREGIGGGSKPLVIQRKTLCTQGDGLG